MKKSITVSVPHHLSPDEARTRIQSGIARLRTQHAQKLAQVDEKWTQNHLDFQVTALGQTVSGRADVQPQAINVELDLPMFLIPLANRIKGEVQQQTTKLLEAK